MHLLARLGIRAVRTEPVVLNFSTIRNEILASGQGVWATRATNVLLDRIFELSIAELFRPGRRHWTNSITGQAPADQSERLAQHIYQHCLLPRLTQYQAALQESTAEVLLLWQGVQEWSRWFCSTLGVALEMRKITYQPETGHWNNLERLIETEQHLSAILTDREWTAPVLVDTISGPLIRKPASGEWCVVDYRLGIGTPEADVSEAVLFHTLLRTIDPARASGIALIRFEPWCHEVLYSSQELDNGIDMVKPVIARLAGVLQPTASEPSPLLLPAPADVEDEDNDREPSDRESSHAVLSNEEALKAACSECALPIGHPRTPVTGPSFIRHSYDLKTAPLPAKLDVLPGTLKLRLNLPSAPLVSVHRGRLIIEIPRPVAERETVPFSRIRAQLKGASIAGQTSSTRLPVGVDPTGSLFFLDLNNPTDCHLLVSGAKGSGKTEWLRMALAGLMLQNTPDSLRIAMLDGDNGIALRLAGFPADCPFWWQQPSEPDVPLIDALVAELKRRKEGPAENPQQPANRKPAVPATRLLCVWNRFDPQRLTPRIADLAAEGRRLGIHLILAGEAIGRDPLPGILRASIPARVVFRMEDEAASRFLLGMPGAERLLGKGDLWFRGAGEPRRLQSPLLTEVDARQIFPEPIAATAS